MIGLFSRRTTVMGKHRRRGIPSKEAGLVGGKTGRRTAIEVVIGAKESLFELGIDTGLQVLQALLEEDRTKLCGPKGTHDPSRGAYRGGHDTGTLVLAGRKVRVEKPRVHEKGGRERRLPTWEQFSNEDPLVDRMYEQMILGVSTRKYGRSLESLPAEVEALGTSKSEVSRTFVARTAAQLGAFLQRPLDGLDLPVLMLDGVHVEDHVLLVALGIDREGYKQVLGLWEGTTESEETCRALLSELVGRGLAVEQARLFVIDGGKGLRKAIRKVFGAWALIGRCRVHKMRNVAEHLPKGKQTWVRTQMRQAFQCGSAEQAKRRLVQLAVSLEESYPSAANSLREGLDETLTVLKLGVGPTLTATLSSTNPIENLNGSIRDVTRRVKRWRGGRMAMRWVASALLEAEKKFRRVKGFREMPGLVSSLSALCLASHTDVLNTEEKVA
jgi:transposase-like protein